MRVALVHDWLTGLRGGERVLDVVSGMFPDADLHTLVHVAGSTTAGIEARHIRSSPLSRIPGAARHYRKLLPLMPWAIRTLDVSDADLVISTHHAFAKDVRLPEGAAHLCYCFTPMRYVWDQSEAYLGSGLRRRIAAPLVEALRRFDLAHSGPSQVTRFVAISRTVAERIRRHYGRTAEVVHPPVDLDGFRPDGLDPDDFYLLVGGFVPYKAEDVAIEAFRRLGRRLVVVGEGPSRARLQASAPANVEFTGRIRDAELAALYRRCRALVYPQEEDFGIVAVEAQACGRPVIALGRGGALDSVRPLADDTVGPDSRRATGVFFAQPRPDALATAVETFEKRETEFSPAHIRSWAEQFGADRFRRELAAQIDATMVEASRGSRAR